jgi:hypothetical protein
VEAGGRLPEGCLGELMGVDVAETSTHDWAETGEEEVGLPGFLSFQLVKTISQGM